MWGHTFGMLDRILWNCTNILCFEYGWVNMRHKKFWNVIWQT